MSNLYVCKEYETPYAEGYRVVRTIEEHNKIIYNQALDDFYKALEKNQQNNWIDDLEYGITFADVEEVIKQLKK